MSVTCVQPREMRILDPMTALAFSMFENKGVYALLLGSGLSRAAQIPTGWEITLDLTRRVGVLEGVEAQSDWAAWHQERFGEAPSYSKLLDALSKTPAERRSILHGYIEPTEADLESGSRQPTKAHRAIAAVVREGYVRTIVTTNFDRLLENALREVGVEPTVIKSEDDLAGAIPLAHARCFILKVHGDYLDTRLRNTDAELEQYGKAQNRLLDRIFDEHGLIICGWSGDWDTALRAALSRAPNRRYPTYWASRGSPSEAAQDLVRHRSANLVAIADADSFFTGLQERLDTLQATSRPHPHSVDLVVGSAKRYLARSEHRILLADLIVAETNHGREAVAEKGLGAQGQWSEREFRERLGTYEASFEALCRVALVMGRWGAGDDLGLARDTIQTLMRVPQQSGLVVWIKLMTYPAALFFTAYALGAAKAGRYSVLRQWLTTPLASERRREEEPACSLLFGEMWEGGDRNLWNLLDPSVNRWTPFNDYLLTRLQNWFADAFFDAGDVEISFEWLELLVAVEMTVRGANKDRLELILEGRGGDRNFIWSPLGRLSWHSENQERLLNRMVRDPTATALLEAGFAGGDREMLDLLDRNFRLVMSNRRW